VRAAIKERFRANAGETDLALISRHLFRGYQELEETLMMWKVKAHVARLLPVVTRSSPSMGAPRVAPPRAAEAPRRIAPGESAGEMLGNILG
jgi:hypothetical protein